MSSVYVTEPPTLGKCIIYTTRGEIEVELFSKETPKTCRNFIQLSLEGYYNNTIFHRLVKGFILQVLVFYNFQRAEIEVTPVNPIPLYIYR
jgi:peptidyl-prolyl cis-trans isomerase SDCCAG10